MALPPWLMQKLQMGGGFMPVPGGPPGWSTPPINPNAMPTGLPMGGGPMPQAAGGGISAVQPPPPAPKGPRWLQAFNKGVGAFAGPANPNLNPQEQEAQRAHQLRVMAGTLLAGSGPRPQGTQGALQPFGQAMLMGQQAGQEFSADAIRAKLMQAQTAQAQAAAQPQPQSYASPIGKLLADRDLASQRNDAAGVAAIDAAITKEGALGGADLTEVLRVRNDITRNSGEFLAAQTGYDKVIAASKSDTPAGDMSLIFGFMKVLDPGSIVKEGEFATVQNSAGIPEQVRGVYNRIIRGERLTPEQRQDFTYQARQQFEPMIKRQQGIVNDAKAFAERNKLPFADIVPEYLLPLLPEAISKPADRDPAAQLPTLWGQMKDDFGRLVRGPEAAAQSAAPSFSTEAEAEAAEAAGTLKPGTRVVIGGQSGTWQ